MDSQKLLILSVIAALLIISGAVIFVQFRSGGLSLPSQTTTQDSKIVIDEIMSSCTKDDQCIVVDTTCSFCCSYVAINAKSEQLFNQMFDQACKKYKGSYCECHDLNNYPSCVNGKCQMVQWTAKPATPPIRDQTIAPQPTPQAQPSPLPVPPAPASVPRQQETPMPSAETPTQPQVIAPGTVSDQAAETDDITAPPSITDEGADAQTPPDQADDSLEAFGESTEDTMITSPGSFTEDAAPMVIDEPPPPDAGHTIDGADDLYDPLPQTYAPPPAPEDENVEIIQP